MVPNIVDCVYKHACCACAFYVHVINAEWKMWIRQIDTANAGTHAVHKQSDRHIVIRSPPQLSVCGVADNASPTPVDLPCRYTTAVQLFQKLHYMPPTCEFVVIVTRTALGAVSLISGLP